MNILEGHVRARANARFAIVASRWNPGIVDPLIDAAVKTLETNGVETAAIDVVRVPGAWEIPQATAQLAVQGRYAAILTLGCVVRGDTRHYEHVADECAHALMQLAITHRVPVLNGVLAVEHHADAVARAGGVHGNKGEEVALAAMEMVDLWEQWT